MIVSNVKKRTCLLDVDTIGLLSTGMFVSQISHNSNGVEASVLESVKRCNVSWYLSKSIRNYFKRFSKSFEDVGIHSSGFLGFSFKGKGNLNFRRASTRYQPPFGFC